MINSISYLADLNQKLITPVSKTRNAGFSGRTNASRFIYIGPAACERKK